MERVHLCRVIGNTCDLIGLWQVTPRSSEMGSREELYTFLDPEGGSQKATLVVVVVVVAVISSLTIQNA